VTSSERGALNDERRATNIERRASSVELNDEPGMMNLNDELGTMNWRAAKIATPTLFARCSFWRRAFLKNKNAS
jgi:hypothetical protein